MPFNPSPSAVHVDRLMTQFSIANLQDEQVYVAGRVFPSIPVQKQSDRYTVYPKGAFFRAEMQRRAPGTRARVADYAVDTTPTYFCESFALGKLIPDEARANNDAPMDLDRDATLYLTQQAKIRREKEFMSTYFKAGVWSLNKTGVSGTPSTDEFKQFNDAASTPISVIRGYKTAFSLNNGGFRPNKMTLGRLVYDALLDHADVIDRIKYGQTPGAPAMTNLQVLAQLFEMDEVLVADAVENTAIEGAADVFAFVASKGVLLTYSPASPSLLTPSAGYTFAWTGFLPGQGPSLGEVISRFRDDQARTDMMQIDAAYDMKLVSTDCGMFLASAVA